MDKKKNELTLEPGVIPDDEIYFNLLDVVSTPIFLHRAGCVIYANVAFQRLIGRSREELLAIPYYELAFGEWKEIIRQRGEARMRGENVPDVYEFRLDTKQPEERWVEITGSRVLLGDRPTIFCSLVDLTDRKQAESAQLDLQQLLTQIVDSDPVATFVVNTQHKVTHWNRACARLTGLPSEEVVGTNFQWKPFYPEPRDTLADVLLHSRSESEVVAHYPNATVKASDLASGAYQGEGAINFFDKDLRWVFFNTALLHDADGRVVGAIEKIQDMTERRRVEEELHRYQVQLEYLVEQRTTELAGANRQLELDILRRETAEHELLQRYAELKTLNAKLSEAQLQLQQSEKLASIGQLAAGVAHEINNPIGYVQSNIGSLEKYIDDLFALLTAYEEAEQVIDPLSDTIATLKNLRQQIDIDFLREDIPLLMHESKEGITRVKKIVQDLKDFSRVDNSSEFHWANLHQGIDSTLNVVANEIKYKADVIKEYGVLPEVECLPSQLNQVFMNLLVNAAHAMGEQHGRITIRTGVGSTGENVWLEFADNGSGMSEEVRQKIFDPFFTTKPVGKGTGLGLSLSYGIIQKHGGFIDVESALGQGTCFRITLPIRQGDKSLEAGTA